MAESFFKKMKREAGIDLGKKSEMFEDVAIHPTPDAAVVDEAGKITVLEKDTVEEIIVQVKREMKNPNEHDVKIWEQRLGEKNSRGFHLTHSEPYEGGATVALLDPSGISNYDQIEDVLIENIMKQGRYTQIAVCH